MPDEKICRTYFFIIFVFSELLSCPRLVLCVHLTVTVLSLGKQLPFPSLYVL